MSDAISMPVGDYRATATPRSSVLTEETARRLTDELNDQLKSIRVELREVLERGLNTIMPVVAKLYDRKGYRVLGYKSWLDYVRAEVPELNVYCKTYCYDIGQASVIHAALLEIFNETPLLEVVQRLPMSATLGLKRLKNPNLQAVALNIAGEMVMHTGTPVTADVIDSAVTVTQEFLQTGKVDIGNGTMSAAAAAVAVLHNENVMAAIEQIRGRAGVSEYETLTLNAQLVRIPGTKRNLVVLEFMEDADFAKIRSLTMKSVVPVRVRVKKSK